MESSCIPGLARRPSVRPQGAPAPAPVSFGASHGIFGGSSLPRAWSSFGLGATALAVRERRKLKKPKRHQAERKSGRRGLYSGGVLLNTGTLPVGDGFELYYEEHGSRDGLPVVFLHGGPGAGCSRQMAKLFDPEKYRVVLFDQRGCGKSTREGSTTAAEQLENNTTWHHVDDLEALRTHLETSPELVPPLYFLFFWGPPPFAFHEPGIHFSAGVLVPAKEIDRWVVTGGSWGSCLALAYASKFQDRVLGIVLRAATWSRESMGVDQYSVQPKWLRAP